MKLKLMAGLLVLAAGGAVVVGLSGGEKPPAGEPKVVQADSVKVIEGPCPVSTGPSQETAKCKGSYEKGGLCYCITDQADVDGEVNKDDAGKRGTAAVKRLWVCPPKDGRGSPSVRWDTDADAPPAGCTAVAKALTDVSFGEYDSDLVEQLRVVCAPRQVTGSSWGPCPYCLAGEPGKSDCAAVCAVK